MIFPFGSPLSRALRTARKRPLDTREVLRAVKDESPKTPSEVRLLARLLEAFPLADDPHRGSGGALQAALHLLFTVEGHEATDALYDAVEPQLARIAAGLLGDLQAGEEGAQRDLLDVLMHLVRMPQGDRHQLVVQAVAVPALSEAYWWTGIFRPLADEAHPWRQPILEALADPLPSDFAGVALLDCANHAKAHGAAVPHPFDSAAGAARLSELLARTGEEASYAASAARALLHLDLDRLLPLLEVAMVHPSGDVRLEAGLAALGLGLPQGDKLLAEAAADPALFQLAHHHLAQLDRLDLLPEGAEDPDFIARAELTRWLADPREMGRPPDRLELVDTRTLHWTPTADERQVWLFRYHYDDDDSGLGMVGSVTFALFGEATADLSPEDAYGLHCAWELMVHKDPRAPEPRSAAAGLAILRADNPGLV